MPAEENGRWRFAGPAGPCYAFDMQMGAIVMGIGYVRRTKAICAGELLGLLGCLWGAGCSTKMETGYQPRSLSAGSTERRGYYASPFTPEAEAAKAKNASDARSKVPGIGTGP
jgi:hypothetical protein